MTVLFEAGARRVLLNTWDYGTLTTPGDFARVASLVSDPEFITLASSHPQGGNATNRDPERGVVDQHFRVHGYENLYVCDASVFPGSIQVNPQMTVMALARYAAGRFDPVKVLARKSQELAFSCERPGARAEATPGARHPPT